MDQLLVADFFDKHLPNEWEIYIQPHLNGLRPDFVLLHPQVGIAVYEVKDWNLNALEYYVTEQNGMPHLMASDGKKRFSRQKDNPVDKVNFYKSEIYELYCPSLPQNRGLGVISAGVIFPFADDKTVARLLDKSRKFYHMNKYPDMYPVVGQEALASGDITSVFPRSGLKKHLYMTPQIARDVRRWLVEPHFSIDQRTCLLDDLDDTQKHLVLERTKTGYRRIKGPAGSGKSLVLAGRAAELARKGKQVLVVTYNITLINYLSDLAVRWGGGSVRRNVTWLNFHSWCRRVAYETGSMREYNELWHNLETGGLKELLRNKLPGMTSKWIENDETESTPRYDAILVDEGQTFQPNWWNTLRKACRPDGEMMLVADSTQDVYGTARAWTDEAMRGCGFKGPWNEMQNSYRLPPELIEKARAYAKQFLPAQSTLLPESPQMELNLFPCQLRWVQINSDKNAPSVCYDEVLRMLRTGGKDLSAAEITVIVDKQCHGMEIERMLREQRIRSITTFSKDGKEGRRKKLAFFMGDARVKMTTIHSFMGWESRSIVIYIGHINNDRAKASFYSALTRLKRNEKNSYLTVVCSAPELASFGKTFGNEKEINCSKERQAASL